MKSTNNKYIAAARGVLAAAVAAAAALSAISCSGSGGGDSPPQAEVIVSSPLDAGNVARGAALGVFAELDELDAPEAAATDFSDEAQVEQYVGVRRDAYTRLMTIELDERDAEAQKNLRYGCELMLEYLDELPAYCRIRDDGSQESSDMRDTLSAKWASAVGELFEAREALETEVLEPGEAETISGEVSIAG
jgi:hypothetical protein